MITKEEVQIEECPTLRRLIEVRHEREALKMIGILSSDESRLYYQLGKEEKELEESLYDRHPD